MTTLSKRAIEEALKQVASKQMLNFLTKLRGKPIQMFTLTSLELNIETDLINPSHSTNQLLSTLQEECQRNTLFMTFKMQTQIKTGNQEWLTPRSMLQFKELSTWDQKLKFDIINFILTTIHI